MIHSIEKSCKRNFPPIMPLFEVSPEASTRERVRQKGHRHLLIPSRTPRLADRIELGKTGLQVSPVGIGTLQWGDPGSGFGDSYSEETLKEVFETAVEGGVSFFDTAEVSSRSI